MYFVYACKRKPFLRQYLRYYRLKDFFVIIDLFLTLQVMAITTKKMQTAEDFRDLHQLEKSFKHWRDYTVMKQIERKQNHITAIAHYDRYS